MRCVIALNQQLELLPCVVRDTPAKTHCRVKSTTSAFANQLQRSRLDASRPANPGLLLSQSSSILRRPISPYSRSGALWAATGWGPRLPLNNVLACSWISFIHWLTCTDKLRSPVSHPPRTRCSHHGRNLNKVDSQNLYLTQNWKSKYLAYPFNPLKVVLPSKEIYKKISYVHR